MESARANSVCIRYIHRRLEGVYYDGEILWILCARRPGLITIVPLEKLQEWRLGRRAISRDAGKRMFEFSNPWLKGLCAADQTAMDAILSSQPVYEDIQRVASSPFVS